jgi:hypothetical protein
MNWYGSKPETPKIEVGSEYVTVTTKHSTAVARILRNETRDGSHVLTLDRLLDRHAQLYVERSGSSERSWYASGVFVTVLNRTCDEHETVDEIQTCG